MSYIIQRNNPCSFYRGGYVIGFRRGHNFQAVGARGFIDEEVWADKIKKEVERLFKINDIEHIDCSPGDMGASADLKYGVSKCNTNKCEFFFSIHFNANKVVEEERGCEIWVYNNKLSQADSVLKNLEQLGFKNRGLKFSKTLYELKHTKCKAMIVEVCFVDSKKDVEKLEKLGATKIAEAIVRGVLMKDDIKMSDSTYTNYRVCVGSYSNYTNAVKRNEEMKEKGIDSYIVKEL